MVGGVDSADAIFKKAAMRRRSALAAEGILINAANSTGSLDRGTGRVVVVVVDRGTGRLVVVVVVVPDFGAISKAKQATGRRVAGAAGR